MPRTEATRIAQNKEWAIQRARSLFRDAADEEYREGILSERANMLYAEAHQILREFGLSEKDLTAN